MFINLFLFQFNIRSLNRYETCIEQIESMMYFPLEVMFDLKYANKVNKTSLKEFIQKVLLIESEDLIDQLGNTNEKLIEKFKDLSIKFPINIGYPDELTAPEFLNKLYANLNLTGEEGVYKMHLEIKKYEKLLKQKENYSVYLENLSENAKMVFEECRDYICYDIKKLYGLLILNK